MILASCDCVWWKIHLYLTEHENQCLKEAGAVAESDVTGESGGKRY